MVTTKSDKIKVVLINNSLLAIKGWKNILSKANDINVVHATTPSAIFQISNSYKTADIILADIALLTVTPYKRKIIEQIKKAGWHSKVILIVPEKTKVSYAKRAGADEALISPILGSELISLIRGLKKDTKSRCEFQANILRNLHADLRSTTEYEGLIRNILQSLFFPYITEAQFEYSAPKKTQFCTALYKAGKAHSFWNTLFSENQTKRLLFLIQNTKSTYQISLSPLNSRLVAINENIGILVVRGFIKNSLKSLQSALFMNEKKIILVLDDEDIINLLSHSAAGVDPSEVLEDIYTRFALSL